VLCPSKERSSLASDIDKPIFAILYKQLADLLKLICQEDTLWIFPVHFVDLLYKHDPMLIVTLTELYPLGNLRDENNRPIQSAGSARTAMITDYGKALLNSQDFWNIGSDYLKNC
jgi:hypothetical protein